MNNVLMTTYYGNTPTQWLVALSCIAAAFVIARMAYWASNRIIKPLTERTETELDDILIDMLEEPIVVAITLVGARFGTTLLVLTDQAHLWVDRAFHIAMALNVAWLVTRTYDAIHEHYLTPMVQRTETELDDQLLAALRLSIKLIAWTLGFVIGLNNAGYNVGAILASLGLGGLAFALAAQDTVANIFGGITVLLQRPFRVGDLVRVGETEARVLSIGLRTTVMEEFGGKIITLPNRLFAEKPVINFDRRETYLERVAFRLHHTTNSAQLRQALAIVASVSHDAEELAEQHFKGISAVPDGTFELEYWFAIIPRADKHWYETTAEGKSAAILGALDRFEQAGIRLALPVLQRLGPHDVLDGVFAPVTRGPRPSTGDYDAAFDLSKPAAGQSPRSTAPTGVRPRSGRQEVPRSES